VAKVSGGALLSLRTFLAKAYGPSTYDRVLHRLPPDQAEPLRGIVLPVNWYPVHAFVDAIKTAQETVGDAELLERYGSFAAEYEINAFQRVLLRFTTPAYLLERAGRVWHRFHDTGQWEVQGGDKRLRGTLRDFAVVDVTYCRVLSAWLLRAGQMTGARGEVVHPECRALGAKAEVFTGWWY
jgi:hypothetical protein